MTATPSARTGTPAPPRPPPQCGLGGTARYVVLPNEAHGYRARESVLDTLAEMIEWADRWAKNRPPRPPRPERALQKVTVAPKSGMSGSIVSRSRRTRPVAGLTLSISL